jgi:hypothetical protein
VAGRLGLLSLPSHCTARPPPTVHCRTGAVLSLLRCRGLAGCADTPLPPCTLRPPRSSSCRHCHGMSDDVLLPLLRCPLLSLLRHCKRSQLLLQCLDRLLRRPLRCRHRLLAGGQVAVAAVVAAGAGALRSGCSTTLPTAIGGRRPGVTDHTARRLASADCCRQSPSAATLVPTSRLPGCPEALHCCCRCLARGCCCTLPWTPGGVLLL